MNEILKKGKIRELKQNLSETDFKILKCYEANLLNEQMPYDVLELISQRKEWRRQLNEIEEPIR